jgi:[acyl-carrier-protein] S-malonyltransferase
MQASGAGREGRMAAIIGLDDAKLPDLVAQAGEHGIFGIANRNSPGQVVVSGERAAVEAALGIAKTLGARRAIELPVSVAAHSPLMAEAAEGMAKVLAGIAFRDPRPPLLANADATLITTADACRAELVNHLTTGVDWVGAIRSMRSRGINTFIEVGPGQVLTGLVKRIVDDAIVLALDDRAAPDRLAIPFAESAGVNFDTVA